MSCPNSCSCPLSGLHPRPCPCNNPLTKRPSQENYSYTQNQPLNQPEIVLKEGYGYKYANYQPPRHEEIPTAQEERRWQGVI